MLTWLSSRLSHGMPGAVGTPTRPATPPQCRRSVTNPNPPDGNTDAHSEVRVRARAARAAWDAGGLPGSAHPAAPPADPRVALALAWRRGGVRGAGWRSGTDSPSHQWCAPRGGRNGCHCGLRVAGCGDVTRTSVRVRERDRKREGEGERQREPERDGEIEIERGRDRKREGEGERQRETER